MRGRPVAWLSIDGVLNVYAPESQTHAFHMIGEQPVWVRHDLPDLLAGLARDYELRLLTLWPTADAHLFLETVLPDGVPLLFEQVLHADDESGWEELVSEGLSPLVAGDVPAGKVAQLRRAAADVGGVWLDPDASDTALAAAGARGVLAVPMDMLTGLTSDDVAACATWAEHLRTVGQGF